MTRSELVQLKIGVFERMFGVPLTNIAGIIKSNSILSEELIFEVDFFFLEEFSIS